MADLDRWWRPALERFHAQAGIDPADTVLLSMGHCATFVNRTVSIVIRVGRHGTDDQAAAGVRFADAFAPVIDGILAPIRTRWRQPLSTPHGPVSVWPLLESVPRHPDYRLLGSRLRQIHEASRLRGAPARPSFSRRVVTLRLERLARAPRATPAFLDSCSALTDELQDRKRRVWAELPGSAIHGDAYTSNILTAPATDYLIDYDSAGVGPSYWDLAPLVVENRRFHLANADLEAFFDGYGHDPRSEEAFSEVVRIRELGLITYLFDHAPDDVRHFDELTMRMETIDADLPWDPFNNSTAGRS